MIACWILCTPRTGSSYLCELLNNTGMFPQFEHPQLQDSVHLFQKFLAFSEWMSLYNNRSEFESNPSLCLKAIYHQYAETMNEIPHNERIKSGTTHYPAYAAILDKFNWQYVDKIIPNVKFILLQRNPVDQAVSLYIARKIGLYHIYNTHQLDRYLRKEIDIDKDYLWYIYQETLSFKNIWDDFLIDKNILNVTYEELMNNPKDVVRAILNHCGLNSSEETVELAIQKSNTNKRILPMTRKENQHLKALLLELIYSNKSNFKLL